jgi:hypothetical protein
MQSKILFWRGFYLMLCLKQQMSDEPTEDDLDEEEFIESSLIYEQYLNRFWILSLFHGTVFGYYHVENLNSYLILSTTIS